jgi:tetratricopeptide (TPR) repeat protein
MAARSPFKTLPAAAHAQRSALPTLILVTSFCWSTLLCARLTAQFPSGISSSFGWHVNEFDEMNPPYRAEGTVGFFKLPAPPATAPKVSADELRHPLTEKARRVLAKALEYIRKGEHSRAIATLREGMAKVRAVVPYAHEMLGAEYLRTGRDAEAVPEFAEAASFFPHEAAAHSNLALSLCVTGQFDSAEQEVRLALYLDPNFNSAQEVARLIERSKARLARPN